MKLNKLSDQNMVNSLLGSNVHHDANANLGKESLPELTGNAKKDAMRDLMKTLDLEDKKQAKGEKKHILDMGPLLGIRAVKVAKNENGWLMKGMKHI